jgi:CRISPR/Cas system endoribonuclease Cas6 (RAMP superfamily)
MKIEISNGELLDKISILELKMLKIEDKEKLVNIEKEFHTLNPLCVKLFEKFGGELQNHYLELAAINAEDEIREYEKNKDFGGKFTELARSVYFTNDKRSEVKKLINILTGSDLVEEKSYEDYK